MLSKNNIMKLQSILQQMFLYFGAIDGLVGRKTINAIKQAKELYGLEVNAKLTTQFLELFGISAIQDREDLKLPFDTTADLISHYGTVNKISYYDLVKAKLPYPMKLAWNTKIQISKFACHKEAKDDIERLFKEVLDHYGIDRIKELKLDLFGGCYNKRKIRGGNRWSTHAFGIAIDLAPQFNQLHWKEDKAIFAKPEYDKFWEIVYRNNFYSLGKEKGYDFQHIQRAIPVKR